MVKGSTKQGNQIQLFCVCQQPYDEDRFMVGCTECDGWFHGSCVGISENEAQLLKVYVCAACDPTGKRLLCKESISYLPYFLYLFEGDKSNNVQKRRRKRPKWHPDIKKKLVSTESKPDLESEFAGIRRLPAKVLPTLFWC